MKTFKEFTSYLEQHSEESICNQPNNILWNKNNNGGLYLFVNSVEQNSQSFKCGKTCKDVLVRIKLCLIAFGTNKSWQRNNNYTGGWDECVFQVKNEKSHKISMGFQRCTRREATAYGKYPLPKE